MKKILFILILSVCLPGFLFADEPESVMPSTEGFSFGNSSASGDTSLPGYDSLKLKNIIGQSTLKPYDIIMAQEISRTMPYQDRILMYKSMERKTSAVGLKYSLLNLIGFGIGSFVQGDTKTGFFLLGLDATALAFQFISRFAIHNALLKAEVERAEAWQNINNTISGFAAMGRLYSLIHPVVLNRRNKTYNEDLSLALNIYLYSVNVSATVSL